MPSSILKGTCASLSLRGLHSLVFYCVHSCTCASACFERNVALISPCSQWSFNLLTTCAWIPCAFVVAPFCIQAWFVCGFPPLPPLFPLNNYIITISVMGAHLPFCMGAHGWVARICPPWEQSHLGAGCQ